MHTRKTVGYVAGALALLLLVALAIHAFQVETQTVTPGLLVLTLVDVMLWMLGVRLASEHTSYVTGVRETVDRLASALDDRPR